MKKRTKLILLAVLATMMIASNVVAVMAIGNMIAEGVTQTEELTEEQTKLEEKIKGIFSDYSMTSLKEDYEEVQTLLDLREQSVGHPHYDELVQYIDRARKVLSGEIYFDESYVFSTRKDAVNKIDQFGDIRKYVKSGASETSPSALLKNMGRNDQPTGIAARNKTEVTIFVNCEDGEKNLPRIRFTQAKMSNIAWWQFNREGIATESCELKKGKNTFIVPDFLAYGTYKDIVPGGGPIYIINPYTEDQQGDIDIYFSVECFEKFPIFHEGDNEDEFKATLKEYEEKRLLDPENVLNLTEFVGQHSLMTVTSSCAYKFYVADTEHNYSPEQSQKNLNEYIEGLLRYEGLAFSEQEMNESQKVDNIPTRMYNPLNQYIRINGRLVQNRPGAALYCTDYIGFYEDVEPSLTYFAGSASVGWGVTHEIGHGFDIVARELPETTNNMLANYGQVVNQGGVSRQSNDGSLVSDVDNSKLGNYWNAGNFQIWWNIESWMQGSYARYENCWRYNYQAKDETGKVLSTDGIGGWNQTEKQVYYWSLATGYDMTYYFDRWGYYRDKRVSATTEKSAYFQKAMECAKKRGLIKDFEEDNAPKLWYQDNDAWHFFKAVNDGEIKKEDLYCKQSNKPEITDIVKDANGYYTLLFSVPSIPASNHLGYEVQRKINGEWKVIAFESASAYADPVKYVNEVPIYRIRAVDRALNMSPYSAEKTYDNAEVEDACRIEGKGDYAYLSDAVEAAAGGDVIVIYGPINELNTVVIDKEITIKVDEKAEKVVVTRYCTDSLLKVVEGGKLTIEGGDKLEINGVFTRREVAAIDVNGGTATINNVTFKDCASSLYGAAMSVSGEGSTLNVNYSNFENCSAVSGGAVYTANKGSFTAEHCNFTNNTATAGRGGAILSNSPNTTFKDCKFEGNKSLTSSGGAISHSGGSTLKINGCTFKGNSSYGGGGAIYGNTDIYIENSTFENNTTANKSSTHIHFDNYYVRLTLINVTIKAEENENSVYSQFHVYVDKASRIEGILTIGQVPWYGIPTQSELHLIDGVPEDLDIAIHVDKTGTCLVIAQNFDFTPEDINKISTRFKKGEFLATQSGNKRNLYISVIEVKLTFVFGSNITQETVFAGSDYKFDNILSEDGSVYADEFKVNGRTYHAGDTFTVPSGGAKIDCTPKQSKKVEIFVGDKLIKTFYCMPDTNFVMPDLELGEGFITDYSDNDITYNVGESVKVTKDLKLTASVTEWVILTFKYETFEYNYKAVKGQTIQLPLVIEGLEGQVAYYTPSDGGRRLRSTDRYIVDQNASFDLTMMKKVTIVYNDELTEEFYVRPNTEYRFKNKVVGDSYAYAFTDYNGVEYRVDNYAIVTEDRLFTVRYKAAHTLTFEISDGDITQTASFKLAPGEKFQIPDPESILGINKDDEEDNKVMDPNDPNYVPTVQVEGFFTAWICDNGQSYKYLSTNGDKVFIVPTTDMYFKADYQIFYSYDFYGMVDGERKIVAKLPKTSTPLGQSYYLRSNHPTVYNSKTKQQENFLVTKYKVTEVKVDGTSTGHELGDISTSEYLPGTTLALHHSIRIEADGIFESERANNEEYSDYGLVTLKQKRYNPNTGSAMSDNIVNIFVEKGTTVKLPATIASTWSYGGNPLTWINSENPEETYAAGAEYTVNGDVTFTSELVNKIRIKSLSSNNDLYVHDVLPTYLEKVENKEEVQSEELKAAELSEGDFAEESEPVHPEEGEEEEKEEQYVTRYSVFELYEFETETGVVRSYTEIVSSGEPRKFIVGDPVWGFVTTEPGKPNSMPETGELLLKPDTPIPFVDLKFIYDTNEQVDSYVEGSVMEIPGHALDRNRYIECYHLNSVDGDRYEVGAEYVVKKGDVFYAEIGVKTEVNGFDKFSECENEGELEYEVKDLTYSFTTYQSRSETRQQIIASDLLPKTVTVRYTEGEDAKSEQLDLIWSPADGWNNSQDSGSATVGEYKFEAKYLALEQYYSDKKLVAYVNVTDGRASVTGLVDAIIGVAVDEGTDPCLALPSVAKANMSDGTVAEIPLVWTYKGERTGRQTASAEAGGEYRLNDDVKITAPVLFKAIDSEAHYVGEEDKTLPSEVTEMPEGYRLLGWASPNKKLEAAGSTAQDTGWYVAVCIKFELRCSIRVGVKSGGVRFRFAMNVMNDSFVEEFMQYASMSINLRTEYGSQKVAGTNYTYAKGEKGQNGISKEGEILCSAVITGFNSENAPVWRHTRVTASIGFTVLDKTLEFEGMETSANEIAKALLATASDETVRNVMLEQYDMYLDEEDKKAN